jgi:hypothetical protein
MLCPRTEPVTPQWAAALPASAPFCWTVLTNLNSINRWASLSWNVTAAYIFEIGSTRLCWMTKNLDFVFQREKGCMFPGLLGGCCSSGCLIGLDSEMCTEFAPSFWETCYFHLRGDWIWFRQILKWLNRQSVMLWLMIQHVITDHFICQLQHWKQLKLSFMSLQPARNVLGLCDALTI